MRLDMGRRLDRPYLLEVVVGPHFRPEQVDHKIAGVDQHPVAGRQALDPGPAVAGVLERPEHMIGYGADMPVRSAGGDDEGVGQGTFAPQVDEDDVLRLLVVEAFENQIFDGGAAGGVRSRRRDGGQRGLLGRGLG